MFAHLTAAPGLLRRDERARQPVDVARDLARLAADRARPDHAGAHRRSHHARRPHDARRRVRRRRASPSPRSTRTAARTAFSAARRSRSSRPRSRAPPSAASRAAVRFPSDTVFLKAFAGDYDGVLTMYHDQGQIATKLKGFNRGVTVTGGLQTVFTTPAHGTAFDIVGKGRATTGALEQAVRLCARLAAGRKNDGSARPTRRRHRSPERRTTPSCPTSPTAPPLRFVAHRLRRRLRRRHAGRRTFPPTWRTSASARCSTASASRSPAPPRRPATSRGATSPRWASRAQGGSTVIGSDMRLPARFAAFANGISIHADDYDDTQLAVAKDRVYGLLTHPTAPALPPVLALAERDRTQRPRPDDRVSGRRRSRMQGRRGDHAAPLPARLPQHRDVRCDRRRGGRREAARPRSRSHAPRPEPRRDAGGRAARELRHDDQALSRRARGRKRRRRGRARGAGLHRVAQRARSRSRLLPRRGRRLQRRDDRRQARQPVDLRVSRASRSSRIPADRSRIRAWP